MKYLVTLLCLASLVFSGNIVFAQEDPVDKIFKLDKSRRDDVERLDRERRERILKKFDDFQAKVLKMGQGFNIKIPVSLDFAQDIIEQKSNTKIKPAKTNYAYASENYKLRTLPADNNTEYIEKVLHGVKLEVKFNQAVTPDRKNLTRNWCLVKTPRGAEGYIPLNLLSKTPVHRKKSMVPHEQFFADTYTGFDEPNKPVLIMAQFSSNLGGNVTPTNEIQKLQVDVDSYLNIRKEANQYGELVGTVAKGEIIELIRYGENEENIGGRTGKWAFIRYRGLEGWVFSAFLKRPVVDALDDPNDLKAGATRYVKSDILRVRDEPGEEGTVITSIPHQKSVKIREVLDEMASVGKSQSKWVRIEFEDYSGWVFGGFLSANKDAFVQDDEISSQYVFPVDGYNRISSPFGYRGSPIGANKGKQEYHPGIDIPAPRDTPILATAAGTVVLAKQGNDGYGNYIIIEHKNGGRSLYGHQNRLKAVQGQNVMAGEVIGFVGSTGRSTGNHLHFELIIAGEKVNPMQYMHANMMQYLIDSGLITGMLNREENA